MRPRRPWHTSPCTIRVWARTITTCKTRWSSRGRRGANTATTTRTSTCRTTPFFSSCVPPRSVITSRRSSRSSSRSGGRCRTGVGATRRTGCCASSWTGARTTRRPALATRGRATSCGSCACACGSQLWRSTTAKATTGSRCAGRATTATPARGAPRATGRVGRATNSGTSGAPGAPATAPTATSRRDASAYNDRTGAYAAFRRRGSFRSRARVGTGSQK